MINALIILYDGSVIKSTFFQRCDEEHFQHLQSQNYLMDYDMVVYDMKQMTTPEVIYYPMPPYPPLNSVPERSL